MGLREPTVASDVLYSESTWVPLLSHLVLSSSVTKHESLNLTVSSLVKRNEGHLLGLAHRLNEQKLLIKASNCLLFPAMKAKAKRARCTRPFLSTPHLTKLPHGEKILLAHLKMYRFSRE